MTITDIFQLIGVCLIPAVVTVLMYLGFKYVDKRLEGKEKLPKLLATENSRFWIKQIISSIILGCFSIVCFYLTVNVKEYLTENPTMKVGISPFFPVLAGMVFGWPSALMTSFICVIFRICIPSFLRWAVVVACSLGGVLVALMSHYMLHDKHAKWYVAFFVGIFVETLDLLLLFLFNLRNISDAYKTISQFDIIVMLGNGVCAGLSCLIIQLIEHKKIITNVRKDNRIAVRVQAWLFSICFIALIATTSSTYLVSYSDARNSSENLLYNCAFDMHKDFKTMQALPSPIYVVDRHIVSESGYALTIASGKTSLGEGEEYDFDVDELIGVPAALTKKYPEVHSGAKFAFSDGSKIDSVELSTTGDFFKDCNFKLAIKKVYNVECLTVVTKEKIGKIDSQPPIYSLVVIPLDEIYVSAGISYRVVLYLDLLAFIGLFAIIDLIVSERVIRNIETIDESLEKIMDGDLNQEIVLKGGYREFQKLSDNMNLTVGALKNYAQEVEQRMAAELKVARDIQVGSLPTRFPIEKEYNLYALMNTAKEVGGDFYDYIKMNNGRILIINADVSGKGVPAAMFMMRAKTLFKSLSATTSNLSEIVYNANNVLCEDNESDMFVTAWLGIFNPATGELNYINAGHTVPLIKRNGKFEQFVNKHNVALAAISNSKFEVETIYLEPGQELLLYTDGATEAINGKTEMYGIDRLIDISNNSNYFNAKQLLTNISDDIARFANGVEQFDDITMLMLIYTGKQELNPENTLTLIAKPVSTTVAINYVESVLASRELNPKFIARISIVIDELFANIAFYAYPKGKEGNATVTIDTRDDMLKIRLIDSGTQFDPTAKEDPDVTASIDDRKRGGLGIFIVKNTMDDVRYEYNNFQNILYLDKKIKPEDKIAKKEVKEPKGE